MEGGPNETLKLRLNVTYVSMDLDERRKNRANLSTLGPSIVKEKNTYSYNNKSKLSLL